MGFRRSNMKKPGRTGMETMDVYKFFQQFSVRTYPYKRLHKFFLLFLMRERFILRKRKNILYGV